MNQLTTLCIPAGKDTQSVGKRPVYKLQAVLYTLYTSGQIAIDPKTGELQTDDIETETQQVMQNLSGVLKAAGMSFEHVIKTTIFIKNMDDFQKINAVYGSYFDDATAPARETVEVARLPKNVNIEISVLAKF